MKRTDVSIFIFLYVCIHVQTRSTTNTKTYKICSRVADVRSMFVHTLMCCCVPNIEYLNFIDKSIDNSNSYLPGKVKNNFKLKANIDFKTSYTL